MKNTKDEEIILEQYRQIRELIRSLINTQDLYEVRYINSMLLPKIKYIVKVKERMLKK